jgi:hypothetical protein
MMISSGERVIYEFSPNTVITLRSSSGTKQLADLSYDTIPEIEVGGINTLMSTLALSKDAPYVFKGIKSYEGTRVYIFESQTTKNIAMFFWRNDEDAISIFISKDVISRIALTASLVFKHAIDNGTVMYYQYSPTEKIAVVFIGPSYAILFYQVNSEPYRAFASASTSSFATPSSETLVFHKRDFYTTSTAPSSFESLSLTFSNLIQAPFNLSVNGITVPPTSSDETPFYEYAFGATLQSGYEISLSTVPGITLLAIDGEQIFFTPSSMIALDNYTLDQLNRLNVRYDENTTLSIYENNGIRVARFALPNNIQFVISSQSTTTSELIVANSVPLRFNSNFLPLLANNFLPTRMLLTGVDGTQTFFELRMTYDIITDVVTVIFDDGTTTETHDFNRGTQIQNQGYNFIFETFNSTLMGSGTMLNLDTWGVPTFAPGNGGLVIRALVQ